MFIASLLWRLWCQSIKVILLKWTRAPSNARRVDRVGRRWGAGWGENHGELSSISSCVYHHPKFLFLSLSLFLPLLGRPRFEAASRVPRCTEAEVRMARGWQEDGKRLGGLASGANAIRQPRRAAARGNWPHSTRAMGEGQEELCKGLQTESALFWKQGWADPEGGGGRRRGWVGDRSCSFPCLLYEVLGWMGW